MRSMLIPILLFITFLSCEKNELGNLKFSKTIVGGCFLDEATRQIRQFNKDVIIIAQTAYAFLGEREKTIEAGCNDYISKPINKTLLYELINKHVNKLRINTNKISTIILKPYIEG